MVATCILLLEKCEDHYERDNNFTSFIHIGKTWNSSTLKKILKGGISSTQDVFVNRIKQKDLGRKKWISYLFDPNDLETELVNHPLITSVDSYFHVTPGNLSGIKSRGGTGCDAFFYLTPAQIEKWNIPNEYRSPLLSSPIYARNFSFNKDDWNHLHLTNKPCFVFTCHEGRDRIPQKIMNYIKFGERTPLVKPRKTNIKTKTANQSLAAKLREKDPHLAGWYDLGEFTPTQINVVRRAWRIPRFIKTEVPVAVDDGGFLSFALKNHVYLDDKYINAFLAFFNSTFAQYLIEIRGVIAGGGAIGLDKSTAERFPVLDIGKLDP
ncbi:MAG: hypothetical protein KAR20_16130, partial [Candidatus Heimdallarchaeota archaeon]|nr:hypothetical protein [Candidatus Heimdallarchaeota archaeon]